MTDLRLVLAPLLAAILSFVLTPLARRLAIHIGAIDHPGPRKIHSTSVPRLGGLAVIASCGVVTALLFWSDLPRIDHIANQLAIGVSLGLIAILNVGIIDDVRPLPAAPKMVAQFMGASVAVACGIRLEPEVHIFNTVITLGWLAVPLSLLWIVGVTNAFNLVDGLDGLSAGLALLSALSLAAGSIMVQQSGLALLALVLAGAIAGFLPYNTHPAKVFLGDSGATAIGFCLACMALRGGSTLSSGLAILAPIMILGVPIAEVLVSMARRVVRGLRAGGKIGVFEADSDHFHHRLLALGFNHRRAVLVLYGVGLALILVGFASLFLTQRKAAVLLLTLLAAGFLGLSRLGYEEFAWLRRGDLLRVYDAPALQGGMFAVFVDLAIVAIATYGSFVLKYDDWTLSSNRAGALWLFAVFPPVALLCFSGFGLYRQKWRFASVADVTRGTAAVTTATGVTAILSLLFNHATPPTSWFVVCFVLCLVGFDGLRASYSLLNDYSKRADLRGEPILIYGAGNTGAMLARELLTIGDLNLRVVGFVDDDHRLARTMLCGYPVVGPLDSLDASIPRFQVRGLVVAIDNLALHRIREAEAACARNGIWLRRFRVSLDDARDHALSKAFARVSTAGTFDSLEPDEPVLANGEK